MSAEKLQIDESTPEHAATVVAMLRTAKPALLERWIELERIDKGVEEVSAPVMKFMFEHVEAPHYTVRAKLFMAMRRHLWDILKKAATES